MRGESGMSLVLAVIVLGGVSIAAASAIQFAATTELAAERSLSESEAQRLADAGHNIARSILWAPTTDITDPAAIPPSTATVDGKAVSHAGSLDVATGIWTLSGIASVNNPNAPGADITRTVSSKVQVTSGATGPDANTRAAWSTIFVDDWSTCTDIQDRFVVRVQMYVRGDLCLKNRATIDAEAGKVQVWGSVDLKNRATVGSSAHPIPIVAVGGNTDNYDARLGDGCRDAKPKATRSEKRTYGGKPFSSTCSAADSVYASTFTAPESITMPPMDLQHWYDNAKPGPKHPCTVGSLPAGEEFDDDQTINDSANTFELTTAAAYDCQYWENGELVGQLAWSGGTRGTLTVKGTIFFDGDIHVRDGVGVRAQYDGQATLYTSNEIEVEDDVWLCGVPACDDTWDPNTDMLALVADGGGWHEGIDVEDNAKFQGAAYSLTELDIANNGEFWGSAITRRVEFKDRSSIRPIPGANTTPPILEGMPQTTTTGPALTDVSSSYSIE